MFREGLQLSYSLICSGSEPFRLEEQLLSAEGALFLITNLETPLVQGPLDLNLILRRDYVYAMESIVSTLFRVIHFPRDGKIVTIDELSFVKPNHHMTPSH